MMHQTVEKTTYCLNCTHEWLTMWDVVEKEPATVCPECQWRLGVPIEFVSSGWWTTEELAAQFEQNHLENYPSPKGRMVSLRLAPDQQGPTVGRGRPR